LLVLILIVAMILASWSGNTPCSYYPHLISAIYSESSN